MHSANDKEIPVRVTLVWVQRVSCDERTWGSCSHDILSPLPRPPFSTHSSLLIRANCLCSKLAQTRWIEHKLHRSEFGLKSFARVSVCHWSMDEVKAALLAEIFDRAPQLGEALDKVRGPCLKILFSIYIIYFSSLIFNTDFHH